MPKTKHELLGLKNTVYTQVGLSMETIGQKSTETMQHDELNEAKVFSLEQRLRKEEKDRIKQNVMMKMEFEEVRTLLNRTIEKLRVHVLNTAIIS